MSKEWVDLSWLVWVNSDLAWVITGLCSFAGLSIAMYNITKHIYHYTAPDKQLHIIRILFIVPLYAIISWLSIRFHEQSTYLEFVRDIYEAFVIYCFLVLILGYVGGEANAVSMISLKPPLPHPWPLCCLPKMNLNVRFLKFCKQACLQFVVIKPIMAVLNIIMLLTDNYLNLGYQIFIGIVYNISYTLALYGLVLFYMATRDDIRAISPVRKFFAVKSVIFATYWQGLVIEYFPGIPEGIGGRLNDFILCCEMSVFAFIHLYSFPWWEFRAGIPPTSELLMSNVMKVLSFKDVVRDVYHTIMPTYQTYVLQSNDGTIKTFKTKTFMIGNINNPSQSSKYTPNWATIKAKYGMRRKKSPQYTNELDISENDDEFLNNSSDLDFMIKPNAGRSESPAMESHTGDSLNMVEEEEEEAKHNSNKNKNSNHKHKTHNVDNNSHSRSPQLILTLNHKNGKQLSFSPDSHTGLLIPTDARLGADKHNSNHSTEFELISNNRHSNSNSNTNTNTNTNTSGRRASVELGDTMRMRAQQNHNINPSFIVNHAQMRTINDFTDDDDIELCVDDPTLD